MEGSKENWHLNRGLASKHVDKVEKMFSICHRVAEWLCAQRHRWLERTETAKGSGKSMEIYFLLARNGPL